MSMFDIMGQAGSIASAVDRINDMFSINKDVLQELQIANKLLERIAVALETTGKEGHNV